MENPFLNLQVESLGNAIYVATMASKTKKRPQFSYTTKNMIRSKLWEVISKNSNKNNAKNDDIKYSEMTCELLEELLIPKIKKIKNWNDVVNVYVILKNMVENNVHGKVIHKFTTILYDTEFNTKIISVSDNKGWDSFELTETDENKLMKYGTRIGIGLTALSIMSLLGFGCMKYGMHIMKPSFLMATKYFSFEKR
ncbi:MAG: hypothetical protein Terrestrivirus2_211 [Terrestrivirus sp.]|jgi:hypothetical protein|uniref:Uncharacterized protein n=1 Tax=Terrestrivirus sp. TaxID=2487775 RepID=A0A3G4ZQ14_9VIRU|nr:MAG: hypothetical protein Terrestrivirus2_211 [Terrestrivirus sp.]